jgi:hypothetical protein
MNFPVAVGSRLRFLVGFGLVLLLMVSAQAQTLVNIDFGGGVEPGKRGTAAAGLGTNDVWNVYSHSTPGPDSGSTPVPDGQLKNLRFADGTMSLMAVGVTNAPGVWGNATGDPMLDSYLFAPNGSNVVVTVTGLPAGRYHVYLYGWAAADVGPEQFSGFSVQSGTNTFGPLTIATSEARAALPGWQGRPPFVVCRDVPVGEQGEVVVVGHPGPGGVAILNGMQILSRGTHPPTLIRPVALPGTMGPTNLMFGTLDYRGRVGPGEARFQVRLEATSPMTNEVSALLFEGDVALLDPDLPEGWMISKQGRQFVLHAATSGTHLLEFDLVARVHREESWEQVRFQGPEATIATVTLEPSESDIEVQLLSGVLLEQGDRSTAHRGVLAADGEMIARWQARTSEATREPLITVDSAFDVQLTPAAIRITTRLGYEILQAPLSTVEIVLPPNQTLTRLNGELVKDWRLVEQGDSTSLEVELHRPVEGTVRLEFVSEQPLPPMPGVVTLRPPQPVGVQREAGSLTMRSEDLLVRIEQTEELRQVNPATGELASFRFNRRPVSLEAQLSPVEPRVGVETRVRARLEETRMVVEHDLRLEVSQAGIYGVELEPEPGWLVTGVQAEDLDDWQWNEGIIQVRFAGRVLGERKITVHQERALDSSATEIVLTPLRVLNAARETAWIGAGAAPGLQLKTTGLNGMREIPVNALPDRGDELLAYRADTSDWQLSLGIERPETRVVAELFHLITIGDGLVGGGAVIRFGILNQGMQQFRVRVPDHWRNVEFSGPNIRRKDRQGDIWTVALQDKAWGGYTLVITFDFAFDPHRATLDASGAHPLDVEREQGTLAITRTGGLTIEPGPILEPLRAMDPSELAAVDRALISRPVLLAYRYTGADFALTLELTRPEEMAVLDAVADRAQFVSVLTGTGEMLTQAGFMVKNNERPHQRFLLPSGATLWGVGVNGEPVRADRDGDWVVVGLPRSENRDDIFAIDLKYAQRLGTLGHILPRRLTLTAPQTDVPGTYAEWILYAPPAQHLFGFGGTMRIAGGTVYTARDGWNLFRAFYASLWHEYGPLLIIGGCIAGFIFALIIYGRKHGFGGMATVVIVFGILAIMAGMLLPALSKAKSKAQRITSLNNLKQIGLAARIFAGDHDGRMPATFEEMMSELGTEKVLFDPETGQRYTYVGAGKSELDPNAIIAYAPERTGGRREVLFADGSVQQMSGEQFAAAMAMDHPEAAIASSLMMERYGSALPGPAIQAPLPPSSGAVPSLVPGTPPIAAGEPPVMGAMVATGIKSLQFDLPRSGQAFTFTRLLSVEEAQTPTISARMMSTRVFNWIRAASQLVVFLTGLVIIVVQWRQLDPRAHWLAIGAALMVVGTSDLLIAWRVLHLALIVAAPALLLIVIAWIVWRRRASSEDEELPDGPPLVSTPLPLILIPILAGALFTDGNATAVSSTSAAERARSSVSITHADFVGRANDKSAHFDVTLTLVSRGTNRMVALFSQAVALQAFELLDGQAVISREMGILNARLPNPGTARVRFQILVPVVGDAGHRTVDLGLPPLLGGRLHVTINEPDADVAFPSAFTLTRRLVGDTTVIDSTIGSSDRLNMSWTPKRRRAADLVPTVFARQTALVTIGAGSLALRTSVEWEVSQGELQQLRVRLPAGHHLLRVSGSQLRSWDLGGTNGSILTVDLVRPVGSNVRLVLETEMPLDRLPAEVDIAYPEVLDVHRQTGAIAIRATDDVGLAILQSTGLERMETAGFLGEMAEPETSILSAWRFLRPDLVLRARANLLEPLTEVELRQHFTVGTEQIESNAELDYLISRVGVFKLRFTLPADVQIDNVQCDAMQTWSEHHTDSQRLLEIALQQRTLGPLRVQLQLRQSLTNLPSSLILTGVHPLDVDKLAGSITAASAPGVGLKTQSVRGAIEVPASAAAPAMRRISGLLAFKYLAAERINEEPWHIALTTERLESWVRVESATFITVDETHVSGRTLFRFEIQNAPTREFRFRVPVACRNVEIYGPGIRRRDQSDDEWRVELQNPVFGEYRLTMAWDGTRSPGTELVLAGPETLGVERETGAVAVMAPGQLALNPTRVSEQLLRIEARELPEWTSGAGGGTPILSYRSLRPGWLIHLDVNRFEDAAVLQGLIDSARLRTVVTEDGQHMTRIELAIHNRGRQSLAFSLPPQSRLWSAFADGRPVRPAQLDGRLLLPLERASADDSPIQIEITYVGSMSFPRRSGSLELIAPRLDLPLKDARWELFLPSDRSYTQIGGTMTYESADLIPFTQDFTMAEYQRQEISKQSSIEARTVDFIERARREMDTGLFDQASQLREYHQAPIRDQRAAQELQQLQLDVHRALGRQLREAQTAYAFSNAARFGVNLPSSTGQPQRPLQLEDETRAAEQQVAQLQKAQLVVESRVASLHANLPTRGLRYSFIQPLQTEVDRSLMIRLHARNERQSGWFTGFVRLTVAFVALWALATGILRFRRSTSWAGALNSGSSA